MIKYIETKCREGDRKYNRLCTKDKVPGYGKPEIRNTPENMIKIHQNTDFQNTKADDT